LWSPDDGQDHARNMLRYWKIGNKIL
jgi:hypothetical protein